jgi:hypothetical protein
MLPNQYSIHILSAVFSILLGIYFRAPFRINQNSSVFYDVEEGICAKFHRKKYFA